MFAFEDVSVAAPELTAAQIVEKNVAARGGLEAWRKVQTMVWIGYAASANTLALPFVLELKRPDKERFEIRAQTGTSVRMYDGAHGWKLRPKHSGRPELEPYTADELSFARDEQVIDGPLIDYAAKGIAVTLDGVDEIEGHRAYRMSVKLPSGTSHHVWVDAQSFLDIKSDRQFRNPNGQPGIVSVFYRNYQMIEGLRIPLTIESQSVPGQTTDKMVIDRVVLNPPLDDRVFAKPGGPAQSNIASRNPAAHPLHTTSSSLLPRSFKPGTPFTPGLRDAQQ